MVQGMVAVIKKMGLLSLFLSLGLIAGCGYTMKNAMPENIKTIHIAPVVNTIDLTGEISDKDRFKVYRPGLEVDLTNAIMNRFIFDGNLRVVSSDKADAILNAKLVDYRRDPLRYSDGDDIQEYRLSVTIEVSVYLARDQKPLLQSNTITGDTSFFLSGPRAVSEDEAVIIAVDDLSRRVVDKIIELW